METLPKEKKWSKTDKQELKKVFETEIAKRYLERLKDSKDELLKASMGSISRDEAFRYSCIANGVYSVLQDIEMMTNLEEKEGAAKNK